MQKKKPMVSQPLKPLGTIDEVKIEATIASPSVEDTARKDTQQQAEAERKEENDT